MLKRFVFIGVVVCLGGWMAVMAQENVQAFPLGSKGCVQISTVAGNITVTGWDRSGQVQVKSIVEGKHVEPEILEKDGILVIREKHDKAQKEDHGAVHFEVMVPSAAGVEGRSVSGKILCEGVNGTVELKTVSGDLSTGLNSAARLDLASVSGTVDCAIREELTGALTVRNVSGHIVLALPRQVNASFSAKTVSGSIQGSDRLSDLTRKDDPASHQLTGTLGNGQGTISLRTVSGDVTVK